MGYADATGSTRFVGLEVGYESDTSGRFGLILPVLGYEAASSSALTFSSGIFGGGGGETKPLSAALECTPVATVPAISYPPTATLLARSRTPTVTVSAAP
jgi:hypothetical protein